MSNSIKRKFKCNIATQIALAFSLLLSAQFSHASADNFNELTNQIGNEYWAQFQIKILQLIDTFALRASPHHSRMEFYSTSKADCPTFSVGPEVPVAVIFYTTEIQHLSNSYAQIAQTVTYYGCNQKLLFTEVISRAGRNLAPLPAKEIYMASRKFILNTDEDLLSYTLIEPEEDKVVFSLKINRHNQDLVALVSSDDQILCILNYMDADKLTTIQSHDFSLQFPIRLNGRMRFFKSTTKGNESDLWISSIEGYNRYYAASGSTASTDPSPRLISLNDHKLALRTTALDAVKYSGQSYLGVLETYFLPKSSFGSSGTSNDKLLEEYRRAIELLRAQGRTEEVIALIVKWIEATEKNEILDRRPEE